MTVSAFTNHIGEIIVCNGDSMEPTISSGDIVLGERLTIKFGKLKINDIVALISPNDSNTLLCKRITHKEFEKVENYSLFYKTILPKGFIFVQGDNRQQSSDSRHFGPVPEGLVEVKLTFRIWPLDKIGWLSNC
uniref:IMP2-like protein n=2 Tax=Strongyloides stercoralis TaxID=6248 RepID=A0A913HDE5_STRER